ncbi:MAG: hypothetical protein CL392_07130 [Acidiferrobacteraceae bacterium]|nr:hypothetical protein [Acidiferrobacteraceae bacterium]
MSRGNFPVSYSHIREGNGRYLFQGDCDTSTVKGVVAILLAMFDGKTAPEIE